MIVGLLRPDGGQIFVDGIDVLRDSLAAKRKLVMSRTTLRFTSAYRRRICQFYGGCFGVPADARRDG